jgi:cytochrome c oxidase subunit 2
MPTVSTVRAAASGQAITEVDVTAESWAYDISEQTIEVGRPIRFSGKSTDTMHSFAVYHPEGKVLFTMMLIPGMDTPTSLIHTFTEPGTYTVRCLEYCGLMHHEMRDELVVVERNG